VVPFVKLRRRPKIRVSTALGAVERAEQKEKKTALLGNGNKAHGRIYIDVGDDDPWASWGISGAHGHSSLSLIEKARARPCVVL
jgi:hypothetical protein